MSHIVYVIKCDKGKCYIGYTENLKTRLTQHNQGLSKWTSRYHNWQIIYCEQFETRTEALKREKFLKKQKGGDIFKKIIGLPVGS